jgi:hypothetical protein
MSKKLDIEKLPHRLRYELGLIDKTKNVCNMASMETISLAHENLDYYSEKGMITDKQKDEVREFLRERSRELMNSCLRKKCI